ncbi:MAG: hypothetical protein KC478_00355 [Bacteriovoracaceae bacterium]|nr:hypothetical protein [Bacteriovoracaceae bacterium]
MRFLAICLLFAVNTFANSTYIDDSKFIYWSMSAQYGIEGKSFRYLIDQESSAILSAKGYKVVSNYKDSNINIHTKAICHGDGIRSNYREDFQDCSYQLIVEKNGEYEYAGKEAYFENLKDTLKLKNKMLELFKELPHADAL